MGLTREEMETIIRFDRSDDTAYISTFDPLMITKLDKKCSEHPDFWKLTDEVKLGDDIVGKSYSCPKSLIVIRNKIVKMSDEQKEKNKERLAQYRFKKSES